MTPSEKPQPPANGSSEMLTSTFAHQELAHLTWPKILDDVPVSKSVAHERVSPGGGGRPVLLVEDDSIDVRTVKRAFTELMIKNPLVVVGNGQEALERLEMWDIPPCLILLDLNMPKMNGVEFLREQKNNPRLKNIPVVVLTTSRGDQDLSDCRQLGVSGYFVKPVDYKEFSETLNVIHRYWTMNQLS